VGVGDLRRRRLAVDRDRMGNEHSYSPIFRLATSPSIQQLGRCRFGVSGTQIRQGDQLVISDVVRAECSREVDVRHRGGAVGRPWTRLIHAATAIGAREYSRSNPPSLSSQITGPDVPTGSERAIGVRNSSPRWGRASL